MGPRFAHHARFFDGYDPRRAGVGGAVLRTHFVEFDHKVHGFFQGEVTERYFRAQPVSYGDHIRTYNCYFDQACRDLSPLFFSIYPDATIYPISRTAISRAPLSHAAITSGGDAR